MIIPLLISNISISQITIDQNDMPDVNDTFRIATAIDIGNDPSATGADFTWDYSGLTSVNQRIDSFVSPLSTPWTYQLVFSISLDPASIAQQQQEPPAMQLPVTITDYIDYFKENSSEFKKLGFGATISNIPMPVKYDSPEVYYKFPLQYQNTYSSNSSYSIDIPGFIYFGQEINRQSLVDGWGTLKLPMGNFDVLRIKSTVITVDSIYYDSLGMGFSIPPITSTEYRWLGKQQGVPLLQINSNLFSSTILYRDVFHPVSISENAGQTVRLNVFPNPAKDNFILEYFLSEPNDVKIDVFDISGRIVFSLIPGEKSPGLNKVELNKYQINLGKGYYVIKLYAGHSVQTKSIIITG